jgi:hypothetical protein
MNDLETLVADELAQSVDPRVAAMAAGLAARYGEAAQGVLFYGSCLWSARLDGLMLDFYLLVDDYDRAYGKRWLAVANRLMPPNVFHLQADGLVAKYAVLTVADFARLASADTRNVSVWARFAQPSRLVWVKDDAARGEIVRGVAGAAPALLGAARPLLPDASPRALWTGAFALTYEAELRSEKKERGGTLYDSDPARYDAFTAPALAAATPVPLARARRDWARRRVEGKLLSVLRLAKAAFTFDGGIDYLAWKITRHSGVAVEVTPWQRRHPLLAAVTLVPKLLRQGAIR